MTANRRLAALAAALTLAALAGCASPTPPAQESAKVAEANRTVPICRAAKECELMWAAARAWVIANAGMKIQHVQPDYIETFNSVGMFLAVRVVKNPMLDGSYAIEVAISCENWLKCDRPPVDAALDFNRTVAASVKPV